MNENIIDVSDLFSHLIDSEARDELVEKVFTDMKDNKNLLRLPFPLTTFIYKRDDIKYYVTAGELSEDSYRKYVFGWALDLDSFPQGFYLNIIDIFNEESLKIETVIVYKDGRAKDMDAEDQYHTVSALLPILYAVIMLNCKNVTLVDEPKAGLKRMLNRNSKKKKEIYKVLKIVVPKSRKTSNDMTVIESGIKKALHICRGHLRVYKGSGLLFGKYDGTYYIPPHIRGSMEEGIVKKSYKVVEKQE